MRRAGLSGFRCSWWCARPTTSGATLARSAPGVVNVGDTITVWPANRSSRVQRIVTWDGDLEQAFAPMSVTLTLEDELDISRGDVIVSGSTEVGTRLDADIVWMDERPLDPGRAYLLKHGTTTVSAEVDRPFELNEIGAATVIVSRPLVFDSYRADRLTGSFVLIDPATNFTAGAGMIIRPGDRVPRRRCTRPGPPDGWRRRLGWRRRTLRRLMPYVASSRRY